MPKIRRLKGIDSDVVARLKREGIRTTDDLWRRFSKVKGVGNLDKSQLTEDEIFSVLTAELLDEPKTQWRPVRHFVLGFALLALVLMAVLRIAEVRGFNLPLHLLSPQDPEVVTATRELRTLHLIKKSDVALQVSKTEGIRSVESVLDRRLLRPIGAGEAVKAGHLTPEGVEPADLEGKVLLRLPISEGREELVAGSEVTLLFSPSVLAGQGGMESGALVLKVDAEGDELIVTVAVPAGRVGAITRFLATSKISVARPCCPELTGKVTTSEVHTPDQGKTH